MQTTSITASGLQPSTGRMKLNGIPKDTGKAKIDPTVLPEFVKVDLSVAAKNLITPPSTFFLPAEKNDPNIIDNKPQARCTTNETMPKRTGYNSDGTPKMDWGSFGTEAAYLDSFCSGSNSVFFHTSDDFLIDAAKQYASISDTQKFKYRPTQDDSYVDFTVDWFCGKNATDKDYQAMHDSVDKIVAELATRIKNGESTDLGTLKNKLSVAGQELSVSQLENIKKTSASLEKGVEDFGFGSASIVEFAMKGVRNAAAGLYANSLPGNLGTAYKEGFKRLIDKSCDNNQEMYQKAYASGNYTLADLSSELGSQVYQSFSSLDTSSKANAVSDLNNKMNDLDNLLQDQFHFNKRTAQNYEQDVKNLFSTLINQI